MFERFTDRARRVIVYAQEEASLVNHNYIGTEHLLLGLLREGEGVAAKALESLDISLQDVREEVQKIIGHGSEAPGGHIPFTPRAKKVLELSLREALQLGHNYIGTEHLLLGLVREGEGVAAQVLVKRGATLPTVRGRVLELVAASAGSAEQPQAEAPTDPESWPVCPRCRHPLEGAVGYRMLDVQPASGRGEPRAVALAFCHRCGTSLGTLD